MDGKLNEKMTVPKPTQTPLFARFKIMAEMNVDQTRTPQDGRIPVRHEGKDYSAARLFRADDGRRERS